MTSNHLASSQLGAEGAGKACYGGLTGLICSLRRRSVGPRRSLLTLRLIGLRTRGCRLLSNSSDRSHGGPRSIVHLVRSHQTDDRRRQVSSTPWFHVTSSSSFFVHPSRYTSSCALRRAASCFGSLRRALVWLRGRNCSPATSRPIPPCLSALPFASAPNSNRRKRSMNGARSTGGTASSVAAVP